MGPQPRRLMRDAVHGEGVEPDLFFHDGRLSTGSRTARYRAEIVKTGRLSAGLLERQFLTGRRRDTRDVERHRHHVVIAVHRDQIHDALFTEFFQRLGIGGIVHSVIAPQLRGELPDDGLVILHVVRPSPGADRGDNSGIETCLDRQRRVGVPLILRAPGLRGHEDRHLVDALVEGGLEADIFAALLQAIGECRAAQPGVERSAHPFPRSGHDGVGHGALGGRHLIERNFRHALPGQRQRGTCKQQTDRGCAQDRLHGVLPELRPVSTPGCQTEIVAFRLTLARQIPGPSAPLPAGVVSLYVGRTQTASRPEKQDMPRTDAIERARQHLRSGEFIAELDRRVAYPTESQNPERRDCLRAYLEDELMPAFSQLDFSTRLIESPTGRNPYLLAEYHEASSVPTVLMYGHGDVVDGMAGEWRDNLDPWRTTTIENRVYGRGTADNKGQHSINLSALRAVREARGGRLGFNAKFIIETGEEIGSPDLRQVCERLRDELKADLFLASDGPRLSADRPTLFLGCRGGIRIHLDVKLREGSHHSGNWGGVLANPATILASAIATLVDGKGRLQVEEVKPPRLSNQIRSRLADVKIAPMTDESALSQHR